MPDSTTPPPPKRSSSGAFIWASVLMVLVMGGLFVWKALRDEPAPAPAPTHSAPTPAAPTFEAAPPPPPPIDSADAGSPVKKVVHKKGGGGGCSGECSGSDTGALRAALAATGARAQGCYERGLRQNPNLQGKLMVRVRVGPNGDVCSAGLASDGLGDPGVTTCVLQKFQAGSYPAPANGCVDIQVPLRFEPKLK